jgi:hypothetical protein
MKNGIIHYRNTSKCLYVIKLDNGDYTVFECVGNREFSIGHVVTGDLDTFGLKDIKNITTNKWVYVLIQNVGLSETVAIEKANLR